MDHNISGDRFDRGVWDCGVAGASAGIAQILFYVFLVVLLIHFFCTSREVRLVNPGRQAMSDKPIESFARELKSLQIELEP